MQFFFGVFLSELSQLPAHNEWLANKSKVLTRLVSPVLFTLGLYLASYPADHAGWTPWSRSLMTLATYIFPPGCDVPHFFTGIGIILIALAIHVSGFLKTALSSKYLLWLGKNSFAVYLLHGCLLRSILCWMVWGIHAPTDFMNSEGKLERPPPKQRGGLPQVWFSVLMFFVVLYYLANQWMRFVDPWCARITQKLEKYMWIDPAEQAWCEKAEEVVDRRGDGRLLPV